ncbi:hypothetical protein TNCV_3637281 [Trichonephila clavipes]|nr:hypothetical protein TNCV_3637281 [Trichonephila clavipes]
MLITDGAPYTYEKIFAQYNWPNIPVRVFTYLIGREVTDMDEVQWMACQNRGYYTHVTTLAEVREQVQKYIPVMSRPVVLSGDHPTVWSSVYADVTDVKLSDWLWQEREREVKMRLNQKSRAKRQKEDQSVLQYYPDGNVSMMERYIAPITDFAATEPEVPRRPLPKKCVVRDWLKPIVLNQRSQTLSQITTQLNDGASRAVNKRNVQRPLHRMGFVSHRSTRVPLFNALCRAARLSWSRENRDWSVED